MNSDLYFSNIEQIIGASKVFAGSVARFVKRLNFRLTRFVLSKFILSGSSTNPRKRS